MEKIQWVQLCVLTKAVCKNIFSTMESRVLKLRSNANLWAIRNSAFWISFSVSIQTT